MNQASHKRKLKLARRMMRVDEIREGVWPFDCVNWRLRKYAIELRVEKFRQRKLAKLASKQ